MEIGEKRAKERQLTKQFKVPTEYVKVEAILENVGLMIGAVVFGSSADIYGRKMRSERYATMAYQKRLK
ncbi:hypothetical protein ACH3XW_39485 [Acanthocheilonema viteae]